MTTRDQIEVDRRRLLATDPVAIMLHNFVGSGQTHLPVVVPSPGDVIDGRRVKDIGLTPEKAHMRIYTIAQRMHYLKTDVWVLKRGNTIHLYSNEKSWLKAKKRMKVKRGGKK